MLSRSERFCTQGVCGTYAIAPPTATLPVATTIFCSIACSTLDLPLHCMHNSESVALSGACLAQHYCTQQTCIDVLCRSAVPLQSAACTCAPADSAHDHHHLPWVHLKVWHTQGEFIRVAIMQPCIMLQGTGAMV